MMARWPSLIGVGTVIAGRPLHGPRRTALPYRAPTLAPSAIGLTKDGGRGPGRQSAPVERVDRHQRRFGLLRRRRRPATCPEAPTRKPYEPGAALTGGQGTRPLTRALVRVGTGQVTRPDPYECGMPCHHQRAMLEAKVGP
jgi:hypothetical protein